MENFKEWQGPWGKVEVMIGENRCWKEIKTQTEDEMIHTKRGGLQPWLSNDLPVLRTTERQVHREQDSLIRVNPKFSKRSLF